MTDPTTRLRPVVSRHCRTPDGWVCDGQSRSGGWFRRLSDSPASSSPQYRGANLETARPYLPLPGLGHVVHFRDVLLPPAPLVACSAGSLPGVQGRSCRFVVGHLGWLGGRAVPGYCALGERLSLPWCLQYTEDLLDARPTPLSGQKLLGQHRVFGFPL